MICFQSFFRPPALVLFGLPFFAGCGGGPPEPVAPVTGKVTFNGEPLPTGTVLFQPQAGGAPATGEIGSDGVFHMTTFEEGDGAVPGTHLVMISALKSNGDYAPQTELLPQKFGSEKSGLKAEVKLGETNVVDFKLEGVLPKPRRETPAMP